MRVLMTVRHGVDLVDRELVADLVLFAMECLGLPEGTEVSVTFVDDDDMADLNFEYRGIEGPTDVLSFECDNLDDGFPMPGDGEEAYSLGDIVIAPDVAERQSGEYGNTFAEELSLLLVHGVLHLDGYDHIDDADAEVMEAKQCEILEAWRERTQSDGRA